MDRQRGNHTCGDHRIVSDASWPEIWCRGLALLLISGWVFAFQAVAAGPSTSDQPLPPGAIARLGSHQFIHDEAVRGLVFTPDGSTLLAKSDGAVFLWDLKTAKVIREYRAGRPNISADGRSIAFGNNGKDNALVLEVATGKAKTAFPELKFTHMGIGPVTMGNRLACSEQGELVIWDLEQGKEVRRWKPSKGPGQGKFSPLEFSPDGQRIALLYSDGTTDMSQLWIYGIAEGSEAVQLEAGERNFSLWLEFSPDGKRVVGPCEIKVAGGHKTSFRIWDTATGKTLHETPGSFIAGAFSPDGTLLAVSSHWNVRIHEVATGKERTRIAETPERIQAVAFSPEGKKLAIGQEKRVRLWNTETWQELRPSSGHEEAVLSVAVAPDNRTIVTGGLDGKIIFWNWPTAQEKSRIEAVGKSFGVQQLNFSPDGRTLAATAWINGGANGSLYDAATGKLLLQFGKEHPFNCPVVFMPGGKELMTAGGRNLSVWDAANGSLVRSYDVSTNRVGSVKLVAGGDQAWWAGERQALGLKDLKTGEEVRRLTGGRHGWSPRLDLSKDGAWVAVDNRVWELATGKVVYNGNGDTSISAFSSDSRLFATVNGREVVLWETLTKKEIHRFAANMDWSKGALAFSPDNKILVTSDYSEAVVWDLTGRLQNGQLPVLTPTLAEMETWWRTMGSNDHWEALQAAWSFAAAGEAAVAFISERVSPAKDFNADQFLLLPIAAKLRPPRAVTALEYNPVPPAKALLEALARGQAEAPLTQAAKAALGRVQNTR